MTMYCMKRGRRADIYRHRSSYSSLHIRLKNWALPNSCKMAPNEKAILRCKDTALSSVADALTES